MIQCRPGAAHWAYFILFGLLGAIFVAIPWLASPSSQIDPITWLRIMACVPIGMGVWAVWLLRARVVSLSLCGALAVYDHHERLPALTGEALDGVERTLTD